MEMKLTPRFYQNGERVFGPGVAELLKRVQEHHSLRAAAFSMEMAYSKAWQIIRTAEDGFGCKLLSSTIGGRHGGGAVLTPGGRTDPECLRTLCGGYQRLQSGAVSGKLPGFG